MALLSPMYIMQNDTNQTDRSAHTVSETPLLVQNVSLGFIIPIFVRSATVVTWVDSLWFLKKLYQHNEEEILVATKQQ